MNTNKNPMNSLSESISNFNPYAKGNYGKSALFNAQGSPGFMQSNSLISNFAFLLLVIFGFIILMRIFVAILGHFMKPNDSPHLFDGMVDAQQQIIVYQDPSNNQSKTIYRSVNANDGVEFTWSTWIFINNLVNTNGVYKHVFSKGNYNIASNGIMDPNNAPGLYIAPNKNNLIVVMNTYQVINEEILIPDIPISKWFNVIIRCQNTTLDVYINGTITRSINLIGLPKQNYGNVYIASNGGFDGYISNLWYYNYALGTSAIQNLVSKGPNTNMVGSTGMNDKSRNYLSLRWFFNGAGDTFNPDLQKQPQDTKTTTST
jgi:hypothetical protein